MNPVEHYLSLNYRTSVCRDEEGDYIVEVDDLPGCTADGSTPGEAFENLRHAMRSWIESRLAAGLVVPEPRQTEAYSGKFLVRIPKFLHRRLTEQARLERVSLNQYVVSLLSQASAGQIAGASNILAAPFAVPGQGQAPNVLYAYSLNAGVIAGSVVGRLENCIAELLNARFSPRSITSQTSTARLRSPQREESASHQLVAGV